MKKIPVREFQLHATKYLKELPLILTQYGKSIAQVSSLVKEKSDFVESDIDPKKTGRISIIRADLLRSGKFVRHDPKKLCGVIKMLI